MSTIVYDTCFLSTLTFAPWTQLKSYFAILNLVECGTLLAHHYYYICLLLLLITVSVCSNFNVLYERLSMYFGSIYLSAYLGLWRSRIFGTACSVELRLWQLLCVFWYLTHWRVVHFSLWWLLSQILQSLSSLSSLLLFSLDCRI